MGGSENPKCLEKKSSVLKRGTNLSSQDYCCLALKRPYMEEDPETNLLSLRFGQTSKIMSFFFLA